MSRKTVWWVMLLALGLAGCGEGESSPPPGGAGEVAPPEEHAGSAAGRWYTDEMVRSGRDVYQESCASCHGAAAQGDPSWRERTPDGKFSPPPLNGTAHTWHHPLARLRHIIDRGTEPKGSMPGWGDRLSDAEIDAALAWIQSRWPDRVYEAWARIDARAGRGR